MHSKHKQLLLASLLASFALGASAQTATPPAGADAPAAQAQGAPHAAHAMRHDPAQRLERMRARQAKRLATLHAALQLKPAQEAAWSDFVAARQLPATLAPRPDRAQIEQMTTPQRLDFMQQRHAERNQRFERRSAATRALYAALDPAQQKAFDAVSLQTMRGGQRHHGGGHGMHHGGRGMHGGAGARS